MTDTTATVHGYGPDLEACRTIAHEQLTDLATPLDRWLVQTERFTLDDDADEYGQARSEVHTWQHEAQEPGTRRYSLTLTAKLRGDAADDALTRYREALERIADLAEQNTSAIDASSFSIADFANLFGATVNEALTALRKRP